MDYGDIIGKLTTWFEPSDHKERKLPGGKTWFYVPHQIITQRLNSVCAGNWESKVSSTMISGEFTVIMVEVKICGVSHVGVGDSEQPEYNENGNSKMIGTPAVRAFRAGYKDALERHGICAYLDEQTGNRQRFADYMRAKGDNRAYKAQQDNDWQQALNNEAKPNNAKYRVEDTKYSAAVKASNGVVEKKISDAQLKRLVVIATKAGFSEDALKALVLDFGFTSKKDITFKFSDPTSAYERIVAAVQDPETAANYINQPPQTEVQEVDQPPSNGTTKLLHNNNSHVLSVLMQMLNFEQKRLDAYLNSAFPGMTADMLDGDQIRRVIKKLCQTYANGNETAIVTIDNVVIAKYMMGIPLSDCLKYWIDNYINVDTAIANF